MIDITKRTTLMYFSRVLFKSFRGLALQNTSLYICSRLIRLCTVLGSITVTIIQIYVNNKINN